MKWIVVAGVAVLIGVLVWASPSRVIGVSPASVTVPVNGTTTLTVKLLHKGWFSTTFNAVAGTVTVTVPQSLGTAQPTAVAVAAGGSGTSAISGAAAGTGRISLTGSSGTDTHDPLLLPLTVTSGG